MNDIDSLITAFNNIGNEISYKKICEFTERQKKEYNILLDNLKKVNSSKTSPAKKGKALENIASFLIKSSNIFEVYKNIRTSTNELDQLVKANNKGKILLSNGIIDKRLKNFIGECKNYKDKVSVTYVGKVCSLLSTTKNKICILFSYHGVSGKAWEDAIGLIRKFYLSKENEEDRFCIIDFNINDFISIQKGNNILQIIEDKILTLQNDTSYINLLSSHELEKQILKLQEI